MLQHISDAQVAELLDFRGVTDVLAQAFQDLANHQAAVHARQRTDCAGMKLSTMGAVWAARSVAGVKVYPTVGGQFSFAVILFDLATNTPLAVLDGNELTRFRTAAITTLVASRAIAPGARKLALFGAGLQGRSQAQALCERFGFADICVVDPQANPAWCKRLEQATGAHVRITAAEEAVRDADIVVTATRSPAPVFDGGWLAPGAFVAAIGTSTPKGRELDDTTMSRADRIIVEWKPQSLAEAGEIVLWNEGRQDDKYVDLPQLFGGEVPWLLDRPGITVFKSVGVGLADVATAHLVLSRAREGWLLTDHAATAVGTLS
jgi:ornithine cyclodeaminase